MKTRILSLIFVLVFSVSALASFSGCKRTEEEVGKTGYEKSGYQLVKDCATDYVILLPEDPTQNELLAAEELNYFMEAATATSFPVVYEKSYTVFDSTSIISIGDTAFADF